MDYDSSTKFISSLAKFLQSLCNGYVEFDNGVEVIGHIYLSVDTGKKIDYILNEKVCKTDENSVTFISNSFHAQPAEKPKPTSRKAKPEIETKSQDDLVEIDTDINAQVEPKSTNYGTLPRTSANRNQHSPSSRQGKRPSSPLKAGRHSPSSKRSKIESQDQSHISDNGLSAPSPAADPNRGSILPVTDGASLGTDYGDSYQQNFNQGEEENAEESEERDIKPNIDADVTFVKEEFVPSSQLGEGSEERNPADDTSLYSQMYHQPYSSGAGYSNQSYNMPGSSRLSYGAGERSEGFDSGQGASQMEGDGTDPSGVYSSNYPDDHSNVPYKYNLKGYDLQPPDTMVKAPVKWTERPRNFKCTYCKRAFVVRRDLLGHMNSVHLNEKPYCCRQCGLRFPNYKSWKKHEKNCRTYQI